MRSVRGATLLLLLLGASRPTRAQEVDLLAKLDANSRFQVDAMIDSAQNLGLPFKLLLSKAQEGVAKKADSRTIVREVRKLFVAMREARAALGPVSVDDIAVAAPVIVFGVKPEQLTPFHNPPRGRSLVTALTVLGDLVYRGVPKDEAISAIGKLWQSGVGDAVFSGLFDSVQGDILQGLSPGTALQNRFRELNGRTQPKLTPPEAPPETPSS
jgi:hypothetical protein